MDFRIREDASLHDNVRVVHRDLLTGEILAVHRGHNLVVTAGRKANLQAMAGLISPVEISKIQLGTGGVDGQGNVIAPTYADTGLTTPLAGTLASFGSMSMASDTDLNIQAIWTSDQVNATVSELGLWLYTISTNTQYCLFAHYTFPATSLLNTRGTSLQAVWDVTQ